MSTAENVYAGIVSFNPDIDLLRRNIESIKDQVSAVIIYDNGSSNYKMVEGLVKEMPKCSLLNGEKNQGIAYALNRLCEWGIEKHFDWILTLDQDSISPPDLVPTLMEYTEDRSTAIVSPNIVYKNNENYAEHRKIDCEIVPWTITSASLTRLSAWRAVNGYDEWLFIDGVDYDFGVRITKQGFHVIRSYKTELLHELGNLKCISILGKVIYVTNHSAFRKYYMARNTIYLKKKLHQGKPGSTIAKYIAKTLMFEDEKMEKMASIIHGISDGIKASENVGGGTSHSIHI